MRTLFTIVLPLIVLTCLLIDYILEMWAWYVLYRYTVGDYSYALS